MLCQFSFSNFRSYRDETTFDFQAAALSEFKDSLIKTEKGNDILPVGVIYGPNGGGKSNLLAALGCVISLVTEPVYELGKNHARFIMQQKVLRIPGRSLPASSFFSASVNMNTATILCFGAA